MSGTQTGLVMFVSNAVASGKIDRRPGPMKYD